MILRSLVLVTLFASAASAVTAPIQCGHDEDPALRKDESPADALWGLATQFREAHDEAAARKTLEYLVQRYPASRWAPAAREQLGAAHGGPAGDGG
jgi:Tfp pilus assembly protein PilF